MAQLEFEWPKHPKIFEINTWPWLQSLSVLYDTPITLLNVPEEVLDLDLYQFDAIWLMGVWERSPKGRDIALNHPNLQAGYREALSDFKPEDVVGSPYAVYYYQVSQQLGGKDGLELFRDQLKENEVFLILDYVPNHVALDHIWTQEKSDLFIQGTEEDLKNRPDDYFRFKDRIYAHGKDPYFPAWTDTVQVNAFSQDARQKAIETLLSIAEQCDGVRCDMAMLLTNEVFSRVWGTKAGSSPKKEFWEVVIPTVREEYPNFMFMAEVYWDMEWKLQQQGFNYCYDKRLYDRMIHDNAQSVRGHLNAEWDYQRKLVRFIENHDEKRAITVFGEERSRAASILALTLPGARLVHDGQMNGYKIRIPIQLGRSPIENDNQDIMEFYLRLLNAAPDKNFENGKWALCKVEPVSAGNFSYQNLIAYTWWTTDQRKIVVVNFSPYQAQGHLKIEDLNYGKRDWVFTDALAQKMNIYKGELLTKHGLSIDLPAWSGHIFDVSAGVL